MTLSTTTHRIYGRWRRELTLAVPDRLLTVSAHAYDAPKPLPRKLCVGECIQLIALSPAVYRTLNTPPGQTIYDVYDPQIAGTVAAMRRNEDGRMVILVENGRSKHGVAWAVISAPLEPEMASETPAVDGAEDWMMELLAADRCEVQWGIFEVVVSDDIPEGITPLVKYQYSDPKSKKHDKKVMDKHGAWKPHHVI